MINRDEIVRPLRRIIQCNSGKQGGENIVTEQHNRAHSSHTTYSVHTVRTLLYLHIVVHVYDEVQIAGVSSKHFCFAVHIHRTGGHLDRMGEGVEAGSWEERGKGGRGIRWRIEERKRNETRREGRKVRKLLRDGSGWRIIV